MKTIFLLMLNCLLANTFLIGQNLEKANIWEKEILAFEKKDSIQMPESGNILFIGSSSIRGWRTLNIDFPEANILNRGFGGAEINDINYYFDRMILKYKPNQIIFYAGENDIASGKKPREVFREFKLFYKRTILALPNTEIIFLSIKPSIKRWEVYNEMAKTNQKIKRFAKRHRKDLKFIDIANPMLDDSGKPNGELFLGDGLHINLTGYELWKELVKPYLQLPIVNESNILGQNK